MFGYFVMILFSPTTVNVDGTDAFVHAAPVSHGVGDDTRFDPVWGHRALDRESHLST